jgi:hypothetical protein
VQETYEEKELEWIVKPAPWEVTLYSPVSLWEMLIYAGQLFHAVGHTLSVVRCRAAHDPGPGDYMMRDYLQDPLDDSLRKDAMFALRHVAEYCANFGMPVSVGTASEAMSRIDQNYNYSRRALINEIDSLHGMLLKELKGKLFFYVPAERRGYLPRLNECVMGEQVRAAFPSVLYDAQEAALCLALSRGTACVFHLMRVLEVALGVVGKPFGVSLDHVNWGSAIDQIEKKIGRMGQEQAWTSRADWKELQEFYSQAISHLRVTKDGWRNYTAHARGKFTEEEAQTMFLAVKAFMQKLSERLSE